MAGWRKTVRRNWLYMVAATLLSVLLWVGVSAQELTQQVIPVDLVVLNGDRRYVQTGQEPEGETVDVKFLGPAGALLRLSVDRPQILIPVDSVDSRTKEVPLSTRMVTGRGDSNLGEGVHAISVDPDRGLLHFEPRAQKVVRVVPRIALSFAEGFVMADSVRVQPGVVAVEGPENEVDLIDSVVTIPISRHLRDSMNVEVPLEAPEGSGLVELSSPSVRVSVKVEPRAERFFPGVPIAAPGIDNNALRLEPSLVDIRLVGPRSAVQAVRPETLSPRLQVNDESDFERPLPISLPPPGPFLRVELEPDSARVVRIEGTR